MIRLNLVFLLAYFQNDLLALCRRSAGPHSLYGLEGTIGTDTRKKTFRLVLAPLFT